MRNLMPVEHRNNNGMSNYFDDFERDFFHDFPMMPQIPEFRTDIADKGDSYLLEAELPGFDKKDIKIDIDGDMLTVSAQHSETTEDKKDKNYIRRERRCGSFARRFDVSGIDTSAISAAYNNGVLELTLPKQRPEAQPTHTIEIK